MFAEVVRITEINKHPKADRLDIVTVESKDGSLNRLVTGQHYFVATLGVWFHVGAILPGYLADDMQMPNNGGFFEVTARNMKGFTSKGIFAAEIWQHDRSKPVATWPLWRNDWKLGDNCDTWFGIWGRTDIVHHYDQVPTGDPSVDIKQAQAMSEPLNFNPDDYPLA